MMHLQSSDSLSRHLLFLFHLQQRCFIEQPRCSLGRVLCDAEVSALQAHRIKWSTQNPQKTFSSVVIME